MSTKRFTSATTVGLLVALVLAPVSTAFAQSHYKSFIVSTYATQGTVQRLNDGDLDLQQSWDVLTRNLKLDKIYIEVMRNRTLVDDAVLERVKKFYQDKGIQVCGGIAYSVSESNGYQGFDYSDPADRAFVKESIERAARHFDEVLLDDYYFFDRKTDLDIKAKGDRSWTQYRLEAMRDVTENLIVKPAKAVNPKCRVIVKMANWYDQYHMMGNDTEKVPFIADGMFSGTESRNWIGQEQHLQPYLSYDIMRFMDNLKPGVNGGGWVDQGGAMPIDRYSEQLEDTLFARCPEMCCFNFGAMVQPVRAMAMRGRTWANQPTSLNVDEVRKTLPSADVEPTFADVAGYTLGHLDPVLAQVGKPQGMECYTPYHSSGEEYLHDYLGMIGLPMQIRPYFPTDAKMVLLTEQAKSDPDIIAKIERQLQSGKSVCVTSGFVRAMQGKGIEQICELQTTGATVAIHRFAFAAGPGARMRRNPLSTTAPTSQPTTDSVAADALEVTHDVLIPELKYANILTHDAWGDVLGVTQSGTTYPILLSCDYSNGKLCVLTVPNDPADIYAIPPAALGAIRSILAAAEPVRIETAPAQVALFRYDNGTFIVQNYLDQSAQVTVSVDGSDHQLKSLVGGEEIAPNPVQAGGFGRRGPALPPRSTFRLSVLPHSYSAYVIR